MCSLQIFYKEIHAKYEQYVKISEISFPGLTYNGLINNFDMTSETKRSLENNFDDLFEATKVTTTIAGITRSLILNMTARVLFGFWLSPSDAVAELRTFSLQGYYDSITSVNNFRANIFRKWFSSIVDTIVVTFLYIIGDGTREDRVKRSLEDKTIQINQWH